MCFTSGRSWKWVLHDATQEPIESIISSPELEICDALKRIVRLRVIGAIVKKLQSLAGSKGLSWYFGFTSKTFLERKKKNVAIWKKEVEQVEVKNKIVLVKKEKDVVLVVRMKSYVSAIQMMTCTNL